MLVLKAFLALSTVGLLAEANESYNYRRFKALNFPFSPSHYHDTSYHGSASDVSPSYADYPGYHEYSHEDQAEEPTEEREVASSRSFPQIKNFKSLKKIVAPFYKLTGKENPRFRDAVFKNGDPYCQEIGKQKNKKKTRDSMTCYRCKDPKKGSNYEYCTYSSHPDTAESRVIQSRVQPPISYRYRRSHAVNSEEDEPSSAYSGDEEEEEKPRHLYRFGDEYFSDATDYIPKEYKKGAENCEKVVKDSMVCMVCKDEKTNGQYEQCSYVSKPKQKEFAYSKSRSYKGSKPEEAETEKDKDDKKYSESAPVRKSSYGSPRPSYSSYNDKSYNEPEKSDKRTEESKPSDCKEVQRDETTTCTICKDPKTGGNSEKCVYSYKPKEKLYKYSRSKSSAFPNKEDKEPEGSEKKEKSTPDSAGSGEYTGYYSEPKKTRYSSPERRSDSQKSSRDDDESSYGDYGGRKYSASENKPRETEPSYSGSPYSEDSSRYSPSESRSQGRSPSDYSVSGETYSDDIGSSVSESEKIAKKVDKSNCQRTQKDSMTCEICKDPKTGDNSERCFYTYKPDDKVYSYRKSRTFGKPAEADDDAEESAPSERSKESRTTAPYGSYEYSTESKPYDGSETRKDETYRTPNDESAEGTTESSKPDTVDVGFFDTTSKKAEIEKFLSEFEKEDRSKCKKVIRDKMTCYQCVDDNGLSKEECAFVASEEPSGVEDYRPPNKRVRRTKKKVEPEVPLEPATSASEHVYQRVPYKKKRASEDTDERKEKEKDPEVEIEEDSGVEPYEYVAETRPVYDEVLGFSLPEYMLTKSEHEAEFDEIVKASRI